jgi:hypothetical protein
MPLGTTISGSVPKHSLAEVPSIFVRKDPLIAKWRFPGTTEICRRVVPAKAEAANSSSDDGRQIDASDEQHANVFSSMHRSSQSGSNVTEQRAVQRRKQRPPSVSMEEGMQNDESDEHFEKAARPISKSWEPGSNVIVERD